MNFHKTAESILFFFFPKWLLHATPWKPLWEAKELKELKKNLSVFYIITFVGYIAHYYLVDIHLVSAADGFWLKYRFSLSIASFCLLVASNKINNSLILNFLLLSYGLIATYLQTLSMTKSDLVPYFWSFIIPSIIVSVSSTYILLSSAYLVLCYSLIWPILVEAGTNPNLLHGTCIVSFGLLFLYKKSLREKIEGFLSQQNLIRVEKELVESQKELTKNIMRIFPRKHKTDLLRMIKQRGLSPLQALDEILMKKEKDIACIFTDIRGYTQSSKDINFISDSAIPNIKNITNILEDNYGIPSFVGDLVFCYFDSHSFEQNITNSLSAAIDTLEYNIKFNENNKNKINRYIILDCGSAIVGNIGGTDSSIEVTALGTPSNRSSRIDEITKNAEVRKLLTDSAIVFSKSYLDKIQSYIGKAEFRKIKLEDFNLSVRDFPEIQEIYYINKLDLDEISFTQAS